MNLQEKVDRAYEEGKQAAKYGDPHKRTFDIPLYESCMSACVNETCHQMGLALSETEEFRKIFLENLEKL